MSKRTKESPLSRKREKILKKWNGLFEIPLIFLGLVWLILFIIELSQGLNPTLEILTYAIWTIYIFDFVVRFILAPLKIQFLKQEWIVLIALFIPAFRLLRGVQILRAARSIQIIRVASFVRRGRQITATLYGRHGFGYVIGLTVIVVFTSAAGMFALETKFPNYGEALWWTAMLITTLGTDFWPETIEGRILCLALAVYAFAIFGYITANVASFLVEEDKKTSLEQEIKDTLENIQKEIETLKKE